jgi:hypothetical protein
MKKVIWSFGSNDLCFEGGDRLSRFGTGLDARRGRMDGRIQPHA